MRFLLTFLLALTLLASVAPAQSVAVRAGTVITGDGEPIRDGVVVIEGGRITAVGKGDEVEIPFDVILHEYPEGTVFAGYSVAHTSSGLDRANENIPIAPFLDVRDSIDPVSFYFEDELREGVVALGVIPGNQCVIGGRGRVVRPFGMTVEAMTLDPAMGMKIAVGPKSRWSRSAQLAELREAMARVEDKLRRKGQALVDGAAERDDLLKAGEELDDDDRQGGFVRFGDDFPGKELIEEGDLDDTERNLVEILNGDLRLWVWCPGPTDVVHGKAWLESRGLLDQAVFVVTAEAHKAADVLAEAGRPVVLSGGMHHIETDPVTRKESKTFAPKVFADAGLTFAISSEEGRLGPNRLGYQAATCVREGMSQSQALALVTSGPAECWGLGDRLGKLKTGADGTFVVLSSDPFGADSKVLEVWIRGERAYERESDERLQRLVEGESRG